MPFHARSYFLASRSRTSWSSTFKGIPAGLPNHILGNNFDNFFIESLRIWSHKLTISTFSSLTCYQLNHHALNPSNKTPQHYIITSLSLLAWKWHFSCKAHNHVCDITFQNIIPGLLKVCLRKGKRDVKLILHMWKDERTECLSKFYSSETYYTVWLMKVVWNDLCTQNNASWKVWNIKGH